MEFLRSFLRRPFAGKPVVASGNIGCFVRLVKARKNNSAWTGVIFPLLPQRSTSASCSPEKREKIVPVLQAKNAGDILIYSFFSYALVEPNFSSKNQLMLGTVFLRMKKMDEAKKWLEKATRSTCKTVEDQEVGAINFFASHLYLLLLCIFKKGSSWKQFFFSFLWQISCNCFGVTQIEFSRSLVLIQSCNRHAIRANVNRPRERLVQGKNICQKESSASRVLDPTFTISKPLQQRKTIFNKEI